MGRHRRGRTRTRGRTPGDRSDERTASAEAEPRRACEPLLLETGRTLPHRRGAWAPGWTTSSFKTGLRTGRVRHRSPHLQRLGHPSGVGEPGRLPDRRTGLGGRSRTGLGEFEGTFAATVPLLFESLDLSTRREPATAPCARCAGWAGRPTSWPCWSRRTGGCGSRLWALAMARHPRSTTTTGASSNPAADQTRPCWTGYESFTQLWEDAYTGLAASLGMRPRDASDRPAVHGGHRGPGRRVLAPSAPRPGDGLGILRPTGPNGEDQEWTVFAIGLEALQRHFFEPDPHWTSPGSRLTGAGWPGAPPYRGDVAAAVFTHRGEYAFGLAPEQLWDADRGGRPVRGVVAVADRVPTWTGTVWRRGLGAPRRGHPATALPDAAGVDARPVRPPPRHRRHHRRRPHRGGPAPDPSRGRGLPGGRGLDHRGPPAGHAGRRPGSAARPAVGPRPGGGDDGGRLPPAHRGSRAGPPSPDGPRPAPPR